MIVVTPSRQFIFMEPPSNYTEEDYLDQLPTSNQKWTPGQGRTNRTGAVFLVMFASVLMFFGKWIIQGDVPWESGLMALALTAVVALLKLMEPHVRKIAVKQQEKRLDRLIDILPALKYEDSSCETVMSDRGH